MGTRCCAIAGIGATACARCCTSNWVAARPRGHNRTSASTTAAIAAGTSHRPRGELAARGGTALAYTANEWLTWRNAFACSRHSRHAGMCWSMAAASVSNSSLSSQAINLDENLHIALLRQLSYGPVHAVSHRGRGDPQDLSDFPIAQAFGAQQQAFPLGLRQGRNGRAQLPEFFFGQQLPLRRSMVQHVIA